MSAMITISLWRDVKKQRDLRRDLVVKEQHLVHIDNDKKSCYTGFIVNQLAKEAIMKIVNKEHPQWISFWNSPIEFIKPTPEINKHWFEIEDVLLEWPDYKCAWLFIDAQGGQYIVAKENGRYGTHIMGWHCGDVEMYDTLEEAAQATFADWFTEGAVGQWNDAGNEYTADGLWLIKQS